MHINTPGVAAVIGWHSFCRLEFFVSPTFFRGAATREADGSVRSQRAELGGGGNKAFREVCACETNDGRTLSIIIHRKNFKRSNFLLKVNTLCFKTVTK